MFCHLNLNIYTCIQNAHFLLQEAIADVICIICSQGNRDNIIRPASAALKTCAKKWIDLIGFYDNFQVLK